MKSGRCPLLWIVLAFGVVSCGDPENVGEEGALLQVSEFERVLPDAEVYDVRDVVPRPDGGVWILSSYPPHVTSVSPEGHVEHQFGAAGEGPSELRDPWYVVDFDAGVAVFDAGPRQLKTFSADGAYLTEIEAPPSEGSVPRLLVERSFAEPSRVQRVAGGWVFETYGEGHITHAGEFWRGRLVALWDDTTAFDTLLEYDELRNGGTADEPQYFASGPLWTACGRAALAVLNPLNSTILTMGLEGETREERIGLVANPVDDALVEEYVDLILDQQIREQDVEVEPARRSQLRQVAIEGIRPEAAEVLPSTKLLCDPDGGMWIARFGLESGLQGYGRTWDVYDRDDLAAVVMFPERVLPMAIEQDRIVGVWKDEFDVQHVVEMVNPLR